MRGVGMVTGIERRQRPVHIFTLQGLGHYAVIGLRAKVQGGQLLAQHFYHHGGCLFWAVQGLVIFGEGDLFGIIIPVFKLFPKAGELLVVIAGQNAVDRFFFFFIGVVAKIYHLPYGGIGYAWADSVAL